MTRNPIIHSSDIRKLTAVRDEKLNNMYKNTLGGCIVFATKGLRSAADEMSGGDFDGDTYLVIFTNDELMDTFQPIVDPFDYSIDAGVTSKAPVPSTPAVRVSTTATMTRSGATYSTSKFDARTPMKPPPKAICASPQCVMEDPSPMSLTQALNLEETIHAELGINTRVSGINSRVSGMKSTVRSVVTPAPAQMCADGTVDSISFVIMKGVALIIIFILFIHIHIINENSPIIIIYV